MVMRRESQRYAYSPSSSPFAESESPTSAPQRPAPHIRIQTQPSQREDTVARVMSPTTTLEWTRVRGQCIVCQCLVQQPSICANCGNYGHQGCLGFERFLDHDFCARCMPEVTSEYAKFQDAQRREAWRRSLASQVQGWKQRAIEAIGVSSTIGVAVGGVIATAAGAAAGLAQGAVAGAAASRSASAPPASLPDAPSSATPSSSTAARPQNPKCLLCWKPQLARFRPLVHTYAGDCLQAPPQLPAPEPEAPQPQPTTAATSQPRDYSALDVQSLFGSAASGVEGLDGSVRTSDGPPLLLLSGPATLQELEGGAGRSGGQPSDRFPLPGTPRRRSSRRLSMGPEMAPGAVPPMDVRVEELETQVFDLQTELQAMRDEMVNLARAAAMAGEEAQRAAQRVDGFEYEWLLSGEDLRGGDGVAG